MSKLNSHLASYVKTKRQKQGKSTQITKTRFPDEIVSKIFTYLTPSDILKCAQVSKQWHSVSNEKSIWIKHYNLTPRNVRDSFLPEERKVPNFNWKTEIIKRTVVERNKKVKGLLKKLNTYTRLPNTEQALKFLDIKWKLSITDNNDVEYSFNNDDMFCFASSTTVRWCSVDVPKMTHLRTISILALTPVFYDRGWKAHKDSSRRSSLLLTYNVKHDLKLSEKTCTSKDDMITFHVIKPPLMMAIWKSSWKDGGEIAFISVCFHHHQLVEKILFGQRHSVYNAVCHKPILDDVNPIYGLHRYSITIELRNQRKLFWGYQYRELFHEEMTDEFLILKSDKDSESVFNVKTSLPWKTTGFKNILEDVVIIDFIMCDENQQVIWSISSATKVFETVGDNVDYTYSDGMPLSVKYHDDVGKLDLQIIWIEEDKQNIVKGVEVRLKKSFINAWFGTKY